MKLTKPINVTLTSSNVANSSYSNWSVSTAYSIGNKVYLADNFQEYECIVANTGQKPSEQPSFWKRLGATNKYKMLDQYLNTQTSNASSIECDIVAYGAREVYLGNISATDVIIEIIDNDTLSVIETANYNMYPDVSDWLDYFYGSWIYEQKQNITYSRTTLNANITVSLTISNPTGIAKCGIFSCGIPKEIGITRYGINIGAEDYSQVIVDSVTGETYLQRGNYVKKINADIFLNSPLASYAFNVLTDARATPLIISFSDDGDIYTIYGYIRDWEVIVNGAVETAISIEVVGLI